MRRRTLLLGLLGAGLAGCSPGEYRGPQRVVTLAAGEPGGFYVEFARLLAAELNAAQPVLRAKMRAMLAPMPEAPPVISATLFSNLMRHLLERDHIGPTTLERERQAHARRCGA